MNFGKLTIKQAEDLKTLLNKANDSNSAKSIKGDYSALNSIFNNGVDGKNNTTENIAMALAGGKDAFGELGEAEIKQYVTTAALMDKNQDGVVDEDEFNELDGLSGVANTVQIDETDIQALMNSTIFQDDAKLDDLLAQVNNILEGVTTEEVEEAAGINLDNSGVKMNDDGTYSVTVEPWNSKADGRAANDCLSRIISNAYPDLSSEDRKAVQAQICEMNGIEDPNLISNGANLKLPVVSYDENGKIQFSDKVAEEEKVDSAETEAIKDAVNTVKDSILNSLDKFADIFSNEEVDTNSDKNVISDNESLAIAQELRTAMAGLGTDEKTVSSILIESGYSTADIVKIMNTFESEFGETLMSDIQGDYSGQAETELRNILYNAAANEAKGALGWESIEDIPEDIAQKANKFYAELESADATGYMKGFDKLSDTEKAQILVACDMMHPDESAIDRVTEDRVWFGKEDGYVDGMINALKNTADIGTSEKVEPAKVETTTAEERATIGNNEAAAKAAELRNAMAGWGTDEKTVSSILIESGYSTADTVKIMEAYEDLTGETLMSDIQGDYSGQAETELRNILYNSAANEAVQTLGWESVEDIPADIVTKANELYSQLESADATGYMKNFSKMSEDEQAKIMLACDILHPGESAMDRLTQDRVWFGKEDGYVDDIIKGMKKLANTKVS